MSGSQLASQLPRSQIALVESARYRDFAQSAQFFQSDVLRRAFAARGYRLESVAADDPTVRWADYLAVLPLGFWGYHWDSAEFLRWMDTLTALGARLRNSPTVLRWNMEKTYLLALQRRGVAVAELLHFPAGSRPDLAAAVAQAGWSRYVIKPTISANADNTLVASGVPDAAVQTLAASILERCGLLVQPFFPEIPDDGEWSLIVAGNQLIHAVKKIPKAGDFRSQPGHGACVQYVTPTAALAAQAVETVRLASALVGPLAYARVDGFVRAGRLLLMELELIEPYLFLQGAASDVPQRFVDALLSSLG